MTRRLATQQATRIGYIAPMKVTAGTLVHIHCELRVSGGEIIESSAKSGPIEYKHGTGQMLAGLESRLEGLAAGDEKSGTIPAAEAFGTEESQPKMSIPRGSFPADAKIDIGARFEAKGPQGTPVTLQVLSVNDEAISARVVHPLAGKDIEFSVKILGVRKGPPPVPKSSVAEEITDLEPDAEG